MELLRVFRSVMSGMIGIQKQDQLKKDFAKTSPAPFIIVGIIMTIVFVATVITVVNIVLS